jgi:hypothetical protein
MTARQARPPATASEKRMASAEVSGPRPDPVAISPAAGPLPAIYVPPPGEAGSTVMLWWATARFARRAGGWAARHLRSPGRSASTRMASTHESSPQAAKGACDGR